ncbi:MAG TPA: glycoside hydrolase family 16 protein [Albitalea sp.]|nr:glycoside hydrolase family 16 protein [Albitalea sp.]
MRHAFPTLLAAAALAACSHPAGVAPVAGAGARAPLQRPADYRLVWSDEFDVDGLPDARRWSFDTGRNREGWYNHELQYYAGPRAENALVKNGVLRITARRESLSREPDWGGQHYTSARLITKGKGDWTYGFYDIRARMPCGKGTWPAIWVVGSGGRWPADGELDIMEHVGSRPERVSSAVHVTAGSGGYGTVGAVHLPDACTAFHDYQMHWTPEYVEFAVDGWPQLRYLNRHTGTDQWPFDKPQFMILNVAIGGDLGGPVDDAALPVTMEVDYVRIWQAPR